MARRRRRKVRIPTETPTVTIDGLSHEGRGVARLNDKVVFVDNALPGEEVVFRYLRTTAKFDEGVAIEILKALSLIHI